MDTNDSGTEPPKPSRAFDRYADAILTILQGDGDQVKALRHYIDRLSPVQSRMFAQAMSVVLVTAWRAVSRPPQQGL